MLSLKPLDYLCLALCAGTLAGAAVLAFGEGEGDPRAVVTQGSKEWILPLDAPRRLEVAGPLGTSVIEVEDGTARFVSSPCRDELCVSMGRLSEPGSWAACLPNKVFVRIEGIRDDGPDWVSY